ncbi:MAG: EFR1 family ferrodoxin, partial [Treponema sp.]|nr:EFR1 family ferrodoxin [Treponema sp.]
MSKNIIFYFTGTGNSLKVAKDVADVIKDCKIVSMVAYKEYDLNDMERIGFVFPIYGSLPNFVNKFVSKTEFPKNKNIYYFTIVTCGHFKWNAIPTLNKILLEKGITLNAGFDIKMVANAIGLYDISNKVDKILKKSQKNIDLIAEKIKLKKINRIQKRNPLIFWPDKFVTQYPMMDTDFNVSTDCKSCGICEKICPVKNIEIINGQPLFKHNCEQCLACIHHCPSKALNIGNKTQNKKRYINPDVTLQEIIHGNN